MDESALAHVWYALIVIYKWFDYKYRIFLPKKDILLVFFAFFYCLYDWAECFIPTTLISKRLQHMVVFLFGIFLFFSFSVFLQPSQSYNHFFVFMFKRYQSQCYFWSVYRFRSGSIQIVKENSFLRFLGSTDILHL